jgi:hypothetical protein
MVATRVADVYLRPPTTKAIKVRPNVTLRFRSGHAAVYDERVMVPLLRRPDVVVALTERYAEQVSAWLQECDALHPARAEIQLPAGFTLGPAPDYRVHTPFPDITPPPVPPAPTDPATEIAALRAELEALRATLPDAPEAETTTATTTTTPVTVTTTADDVAAWLARHEEMFREAESVSRVRQEGGRGPGGAAEAEAEAPDSAGDAGPAAAANHAGDDGDDEPAAPATEPEPPRPQRRVLTPAQKKKANARKAAARKKARQAQARA